jgi:hypothetical protein
MKSILNRLILLPFVLLIWTLPGCETSDVKESTSDAVGWARSELKVDAIEATGTELKLFSISTERNLLGGKFIFRNSKDEKITIKTEAKTPEVTELRIQVGLMGDKAQSELLLEKIRENLAR